ncbi:hypothetical protein ACTQ5K_03165 [Niallia sp. Sow4_A1]|uniref:Uncharacterized protein n=3 Tax=Niallia TaxID=2837506 RepID=A0ABV1F324_9BACI|nr:MULTISPECIES: hypothetical protein [Bacillaceae]MCF2649992.1 hypothetical protein [Niallia circulans]MCM3365039.1 hypothetical protein [Niallia sp. MER TA 168]CAI9391575.1 hypothetical protein BACSP_03053 [Bacillus sp. T2.9-1]
MKNSLQLIAEVSYSLNFLIYVQNIFLNQNEDKDNWKFPYLPTTCQFRNDFLLRYRALWTTVTKRISENRDIDQDIFYNEKHLFYQELFHVNDDNLTAFNEIYDSYFTWWTSLAGGFSIERAMGERIEHIYHDVANILLEERIIPKKPLNIIFIYDDPLVEDSPLFSYFAVLSIKECMIHYEEVVARIRLCVE